jgi:phosphate starvation-inducible PhoH-like protein
MSSKTGATKGKAKPAEKRKRDPRHGTSLTFNDVRLTESQLAFYHKIMDNDIVVATGPAGTSKTFTACYAALKLLERGEIDKIYLTKPIQESGEKLGFLPGEVDDKIGPYMESFLNNMCEIADGFEIGNLIVNKQIEFKPLTYMRGTGYKNCVMILDEAQNCDMRKLMLYVTRMGRGSKMVIAGDVSQYDIEKKKIALPAFASKILVGCGAPNIAHHAYTKEDIVRNPILIAITDQYERLLASGEITETM